VIDDIVEMILKEARGRQEKDFVSKLHSVSVEIDLRLIDIMANFLQDERDKLPKRPKKPWSTY